VTANEGLTAEALVALCKGDIPTEFQGGSDVTFWNDGGETTPRSAQQLIDLAKERLALHLVEGGSSEKSESPDCYTFQMEHNFPLTREMFAAGWRQWQITVQTRTDEDCRAAQVKRKKFRYACHFWQGPEGNLALGKVKMQGKHTPCSLEA